jgi:hypothetical protein
VNSREALGNHRFVVGWRGGWKVVEQPLGWLLKCVYVYSLPMSLAWTGMRRRFLHLLGGDPPRLRACGIQPYPSAA